MRKSLLATIVFLILALPSSALASNSRIIGGHDTASAKWPFIVSLVERSNPSSYWGHFCGGSLVAPRWVLTAAHCLYEDSEIDTDVVVGRTDLKKRNGQRIAVVKVYGHPNRNALFFGWDAALVYLAKPVRGAKPVPLASSLPPDGASLKVAGWGARSKDFPSVLQEADVLAIPDSFCQGDSSYGESFFAESDMCAGYASGGVDSCQGDSGGPLIYGRSLVGIVSNGIGCAEPNFPGVYTKIAAVRSWVLEQISSPPSSYVPRSPGKEYAAQPPRPKMEVVGWMQDDESVPGGTEMDLYVGLNRSATWLRAFFYPRKASARLCVQGVCYKRGDRIPFEPSPGRRGWRLPGDWSKTMDSCPVFSFKAKVSGNIIYDNYDICSD